MTEYEIIKQKYKDYIIIQKQGIFYNVSGIDIYIINYIFDNQIKNNGKTLKIGFPNIDKVTDELNRLKINYIVVNEIKKKFKNNNYYKYNIDNIIRINKIISKLKNNILNELILTQIESIIWKINY